MRRLCMEELQRPLYFCRGAGDQELYLYFATDGDFLTVMEIVQAIREELDCNGYPVDAIRHSNDTHAGSEMLRVAIHTVNTEGVPEKLLVEIRQAIQVKCWGTAVAYVKEYSLDGRHLNTEAFIEIESGRPAPDIKRLEKEELIVTREGSRYRFLLPEIFQAEADMNVSAIAEMLGLFLQGEIEINDTPVEESRDNDMSRPENHILEVNMPDNLEECLTLWLEQASPPPEES